MPTAILSRLELLRAFPPAHTLAPTRTLRTPSLLEAAKNMEAVTGLSLAIVEELCGYLNNFEEGVRPTVGDLVDVTIKGRVMARNALITRDDCNIGTTVPPYSVEGVSDYVRAENTRLGSRTPDLVQSWAVIRRGRDLFIPGLPSFNIPDAVNALVEQSLDAAMDVDFQNIHNNKIRILARRNQSGAMDYLRKLQRLDQPADELIIYLRSVLADTDASLSTVVASRLQKRTKKLTNSAIKLIEEHRLSAALHTLAGSTLAACLPITPDALRSFGHFPALRGHPRALRRASKILALDHDSPPLKHLVAHASWWNDVENANALDELERAADWYTSNNGNCAVATQTTRWAQRWALRWPEGGEAMPPRTLLNCMRELKRHRQLVRQLGPDERYAHLDSLEDPPAEPGSTHVLRVLRSKYDVAMAADELNNCALSYAERVKRRKYVLVAMVDGTGRAKALAGYVTERNLGQASWDHDPVERGNRTASAEKRALFDAFLPTLRAWGCEVNSISLRQLPGIGKATRALLVRAGVPNVGSLQALANDLSRLQEVRTAILADAEASPQLMSRAMTILAVWLDL